MCAQKYFCLLIFLMTKYLITTSALAVVMAVFICCIVYIVPNLAPMMTSPTYCQYVRKAKKTMQKVTKLVTSPWTSLPKNKILYVWSQTGGQLGNQLFAYASAFGIAWQTKRHPLLLPTVKNRKQYDLSIYFNIMTTVDYGKKTVQVINLKFVTLTHCTRYKGYISK